MASKVAKFWVLAALFAASLEPIVIKLGFSQGMSPWQLLVARNLIAAVAILLLVRKWPRWPISQWREVIPVALLLLTTNTAMILALQSLPAVMTITVISTTPAFVALVNARLGRDLLGFRFWLGFLACWLGVWLTVGGETWVWNQGFLFLLLAVVSSTTYRTKLDGLTQRVAAKEVSVAIFCTNALVVSLFFLPWQPLPKAEMLPLTLWIGAAAAFANLAFLSAISLVGATKMSLYDLLQRPTVVLVAALVLGEPLSPLQILGFILVVFGVRFAKVQRKVSS